jgi:hypothetical protein
MSDMELAPTESARLFRLKCQGATFAIATELVLQHQSLFQADRSCLDVGEYEVTSAVPLEIFADFVKMIEGKPIVLRGEDIASLRAERRIWFRQIVRRVRGVFRG